MLQSIDLQFYWKNEVFLKLTKNVVIIASSI